MAEEENTFRKSFLQSPWTLLTVAIRAVGTLSVIKIVSIYFGSAGLALFSHFQNLISLVTQIPEQGTNLGVIRRYNGFNDKERKILLGTSFLLNIGIFILVSILLLFFKDFFLKHFQNFLDTPIYLWILLASVFFVLLNSLAFAFLYARQSFRLLFGITIGNVVLVVLAVYKGALSSDLQVLMIAFAIGWAAYSVINFIFLLVRKELPMPTFRWDKKIGAILIRFIGIALIGVVLSKWVDYFVRDFAFEWFGTEITGHWQAQVRLSESYRSVFMGTVGVIFYSQISRMEVYTKEWMMYVRKMMIAALAVTLIGLIVVWLLRNPIILILFQPDLLPAGEFIQYQLLADLFAMPSYLLVFIMIATQRWNLFISLHLVSALVYVLMVSLLLGLTDLGISGIPIANLIRFGLFMSLLILLQRKALFR